MKNRYWVVIFLSIFILSLGGFIYYNSQFETRDVAHSTFYDIYRVTAPFGVFIVEGHGEGGGCIIVFHGEFDFEMMEQYVVKYFDGNEVKTGIYNAEETPLVVDGTLRLERIVTKKTSFWKSTGDVKWVEDSYLWNYQYKVHIPFLPNTEPMTEEWQTG